MLKKARQHGLSCAKNQDGLERDTNEYVAFTLLQLYSLSFSKVLSSSIRRALRG